MSTKQTRRFLLIKNGESSDLYENGWIPASVLIALADKQLLWEDLTREYEEEKEVAILAYRNSRFYEMSVLKTLTTPIKVMAIRAFSLYALHEERGTEEEFMMEKIKKGFNRYVLYVNNQSNFDWMSLFRYIEEREPGLSEMEKHDIMMVVTYLLGNDAGSHFSNVYGKSILSNVNQNFEVTATGDVRFRENLKKKEMAGLSAISKILGFKVPKSTSFDELISQHESYLIKNVITDAERKVIAHQDNFEPLYRKGLYRYFKPLTSIMREMNFNDFNFLATADVTRDELLTIWGMFDAAKELGRVTADEWEHYFTASLLIMMLGKHYQQLSNFYLESMEHEEETILKKQADSQKRQEWEIEQEHLRQKVSQLEKEMESKLTAKDAYIEELERKVKAASQENEETESLKKEVVSLRNYAYQHQQELEISPETDNVVSPVTLLKEWTAQHPAVLFGGHPQTVSKLKLELPDLMFREVDSLNRDLDFLKQQEVVFLITNYFNHPFYYKLMKELQSLPNTRLIYLTGYPNMERTANEMWAGIQGTQSN